MSELLTADEYRALAAEISAPQGAFIGGEFRPARSGRTFTSSNPATGAPLAEVAACDADDVDDAVAAARAAFDGGVWSRSHPAERKKVLLRLADLIDANSRSLALLESIDSGKPILECETVDVPETAEVIRWHAESIDKIYDQVSPPSNDHIAMIVREPIGVAGLVLPWNFPLMMLAWKIGPALAAGCSVVVKPAEETSLSTLAVAGLLNEAGIPPGVVNVVPGTGPECGEPLGRHPGVDMISFTGSTETGRRFLHYSADSNLKEVVLEMGGKNPCIVMDDAEDLESVAENVVEGAFWNMGENCSAASRLIVHRDIKDRLLEQVTAAADRWPVGDPLDPAVRIGALVSPDHFAKVNGYLEAARAENVVYGGAVVAEGIIEPTIVEITRDSALATEEIFGPIASVIVVDSLEEAIAVANDTDYGLAASVFTANGKRALRAARELRAGTVTVNCFGEGDRDCCTFR